MALVAGLMYKSMGVPNEQVFAVCRRLSDVGCGFYPNNRFVHVDVRGTRALVQNDRPIVGRYGVNAEGSGDMYYKGGNMLHTIRQVVGDDAAWRRVLRGLNATYRHAVVTGADVQAYIGRETGNAFNVGVGELVDTWGFGPTARRRLQSACRPTSGRP